MTESIFTTRFQKLQKKLQPHEAILLSHPSDIHYFSGFGFLVPEEREAFLILTPKGAFLIHTSFSPLPHNNSLTFLPRCNPTYLKKHLLKIHKTTPFEKLLIDEESLFVDEYLSLKEILGIKSKKLDRKLIWEIRNIKDELEISAIQDACQLTSQAFKKIKKKISAGITEIDLRNLLEKTLEKMGSTKPAFPTIVAFGKNTALPHHQPTSKKLQKEMAVLIDFGVTVRNYRSDMTRSFWFGKNPDEEFLKIESIVKNAYKKALEKLGAQFKVEELTILSSENKNIKKTSSSQNAKPPITNLTAKDIDDVARTYITQAGYGKNFNHTTGHGVGLEIHEQPSISWANETKLTSGMVITIEPGIYISGKFGYRYENTVFIK